MLNISNISITFNSGTTDAKEALNERLSPVAKLERNYSHESSSDKGKHKIVGDEEHKDTGNHHVVIIPDNG